MGEQARIAVIGAGWAGIAAAVTCADAGAAVTLFEAGRVAGGRARSVNVAGRTLDNGQHILLGAYHETLALMRQVGADPQRMFSRRPLCLLEGDTFQLRLPNLPAPLHLAAGLLGAHGVSWREKSALHCGCRASSGGNSASTKHRVSPNGSTPPGKPVRYAGIYGNRSAWLH